MDFTIKAKPFSWNDNFSEVAREDFSMIQKDLSYCTCQNIGMALAKLELLENQGCEVVEQKHGRWMLESKTENCNGGHTHYCDRCHDYYTTEADSLYFCPRCSAKMIGVEQPGRNGWKLDFVDGEWKKVWGVINERFMKTRTEEDFPNCGAKMLKGTEE